MKQKMRKRVRWNEEGGWLFEDVEDDEVVSTSDRLTAEG